MKSLAVIAAVILGIVYGNPIQNGGTNCTNCFTGPTGPTPKPIDECDEADTCAVFGGWRVGNFQKSSDESVYVSCTGSEYFYCTRCPRNNNPNNPEDYLIFNETCDKCIRRGEECEPYVHAPTGTPIPVVPYDKDFCIKPPRNGQVQGNFVDTVHTNWYYACASSITYHMPCASPLQFFNATCNACMFPGGHI